MDWPDTDIPGDLFLDLVPGFNINKSYVLASRENSPGHISGSPANSPENIFISQIIFNGSGSSRKTLQPRIRVRKVLAGVIPLFRPSSIFSISIESRDRYNRFRRSSFISEVGPRGN